MLYLNFDFFYRSVPNEFQTFLLSICPLALLPLTRIFLCNHIGLPVIWTQHGLQSRTSFSRHPQHPYVVSNFTLMNLFNLSTTPTAFNFLVESIQRSFSTHSYPVYFPAFLAYSFRRSFPTQDLMEGRLLGGLRPTLLLFGHHMLLWLSLFFRSMQGRY